MRFYGIPSEDRALEIVENIQDEQWIFVDNQRKEKRELDKNQAKEELIRIIHEVKSWKEGNKFIPSYTVFIFVHEPQMPKVFKIYDTSSLGCATSLSPPHWMVYSKEFEDKL